MYVPLYLEQFCLVIYDAMQSGEVPEDRTAHSLKSCIYLGFFCVCVRVWLADTESKKENIREQ
jgi:hypothetical protein